MYQENDIRAGIQYLVELADRLQLPLVLCLALGSNQGDHMGYTPLDISLQNLGTVPGIASVTPQDYSVLQPHSPANRWKPDRILV